MIHEMEEDDGRSKQEQEELEQFLSDQEKQTVANLEEHMNRMFKQLFGGHDAEKRTD